MNKRQSCCSVNLIASVAELVDALDSKSNCSDTVRVQVSSEAQQNLKIETVH